MHHIRESQRQPQHQIKKCGHITQVANANKNRSSINATQNLANYSFPKHNSDAQYRCPHGKIKGDLNVNPSYRVDLRTGSAIKPNPTKVIYQRFDEYVENMNNFVKTDTKSVSSRQPKVTIVEMNKKYYEDINEASPLVKNYTAANVNVKNNNNISVKGNIKINPSAKQANAYMENVNDSTAKAITSQKFKPNEHNSTRNVTEPEIINKNVQQKNTNKTTGQVNKTKSTKSASAENNNKTKNNNAVTQKINSNNANTRSNPSPQKPPQNNAPAPPKNSIREVKNDNITEIFKRPEPILQTQQYTNPAANFGPPNSENLNFQQVTQDLANIIKNFQMQIHDVPANKATMEEVPSSMIQPKIKEFFKNPPPTSAGPQKSIVDKKQSTSKDQSSTSGGNQPPSNNNNKNQNHSNTKLQTRTSGNSISKKHSLKRLSRTSISSRHSNDSCRRFHSSTNNTMTMKPSRSNRQITKRSSFFVDPLKQLKEEVQKAIRERKTFTVRGHYLPIRKALHARGWVEKFHISYKDQLNESMKRYQNYSISELLPLMRREDLTTMCKNIIKSKLLGAYQVDFYWATNYDAFKENPDKIKLTLINKLKREIFSYTNKQGLCEASKFSYWYQKNNISKLNHPRSYSLVKTDDVNGFTEDFNMTAAMSLLKWVVKMNVTKECKLLSPSGKITLEAFDFAVNECCKFIKKARHEDIDMQIPKATEKEWNQFLDYFYKLVHYNNHFKTEGYETEDSLVRKSNYVLNNLKEFYPYVDMDGMMNIWILKPTQSSRGRGIHMCRTQQYVLKTIKQNSSVRYIIQKYIERPLLIYNTKFDIRQWFLISNCTPLTIWMYKESYLRFSSQTYNLRKLHESIHLTNNSVQCKYKNTSVDTALPSYNMWDSTEFENYLLTIGYPNAFKNIIYPGMRQCITAAVLMHQDKMAVRKNCFELYGADFILTEDFQPWLLEINSSPALYSSTPVTARMCPKVLEDVIKVVIDYGHNNKADTGSFEKIYKGQMMKLPLNANLEVKGLPLQRSYFFNAPDQELKKPFPMLAQRTSARNSTHDCFKKFGEEIKKTLKNLLQIIQNEKQKRGLEY